MPGHRGAVLVGSDVGVWPGLQLLQVRRKLQKCHVLRIGRVSHYDNRMKRKVFREVEQKNEDNVDDDGNPCGFSAARTRQIVLQLDEQMRHAGIVVEGTVRGFPSLGIIQPELLRLRLLGWSHRVLEWNLRDGHGLICLNQACPLDTDSLRYVASRLSRMTQRTGVASYPYFRIFPRILLTHSRLRVCHFKDLSFRAALSQGICFCFLDDPDLIFTISCQ